LSGSCASRRAGSSRLDRLILRPRVDLGELLAAEGEMGSVVELVARYERQLVQSGEVPTLREIERLLRIKQQLSDAAKLERLNALTRRALASRPPVERRPR